MDADKTLMEALASERRILVDLLNAWTPSATGVTLAPQPDVHVTVEAGESGYYGAVISVLETTATYVQRQVIDGRLPSPGQSAVNNLAYAAQNLRPVPLMLDCQMPHIALGYLVTARRHAEQAKGLWDKARLNAVKANGERA